MPFNPQQTHISSLTRQDLHAARFACVTMALALVLMLTGCVVHRYSRPYPATPELVGIKVVNIHPTGFAYDLPGANVYYDPKRRVAFAGYHKAASLWNYALFPIGAAGELLFSGINRVVGMKRFGGEREGSLQLDLIHEAEAALAKQVAACPTKKLTLETSAEATLTILPYAVLVFSDGGEGRLYAALKATLTARDGKERWSGRYFAEASKARKLEGFDGWIYGTRFQEGLRSAIDRAAWALVQDISGAFTGTRTVKIKGRWVWIAEGFFDVPAVVLAEDDGDVIVRMVVGPDIFFSGTHVLPKCGLEIKDTTFAPPQVGRSSWKIWASQPKIQGAALGLLRLVTSDRL